MLLFCGVFLLALSVALVVRVVFRFKANKGSGMGQDITFSFDYLLFMLTALAGAWCFIHEWPPLLGLGFGFIVAKFILHGLLGSLLESEN